MLPRRCGATVKDERSGRGRCRGGHSFPHPLNEVCCDTLMLESLGSFLAVVQSLGTSERSVSAAMINQIESRDDAIRQIRVAVSKPLFFAGKEGGLVVVYLSACIFLFSLFCKVYPK